MKRTRDSSLLSCPVRATALAAAIASGRNLCVAAPINGQVLGGGTPIAGSTVTLWAASAGAPKSLAQATTGADGRFALPAPDAPDAGASLYLIAKGGRSAADKGTGPNDAIALMTVLGGRAPAKVTINEMTTVASVWTHNQFIDGTAIKGLPLQLKITAGNVPSFVDLATGGWGTTIQDPLNSGQTTDDGELRHAGRRARRLRRSGGARRVRKLYAAAKGPCGRRCPTDTLARQRRRSRARRGISRSGLSPARCFLPRTAGQEPAPGAVHAVPAGRAQRLGAAAEVRRWRLPRRRQGDVRRRGQPLGRQQLHDRMAGQRRVVAGHCQQVRSQRQAAVADHHRLYRRRHGRRHFRRSHRPEGQRLAGKLRQQVHCGVQQGRQAADPTGWHQFRPPAWTHAGHHHGPQRRRVGARHLEAAAAALPQRATGTTAGSSARATVPSPASPLRRRSISPSTSRTASGSRTARSTSSDSLLPIRARR